MAVGMHGGAPEPPALSTHPIDFRTDRDTIRAIWRVTGGLLIVAGTLYLATPVLYSVAGNLGRAMFAAIVAAALFLGGTSLLAQRYSAGPDTARRSTGIVGLAIGPGAPSLFPAEHQRRTGERDRSSHPGKRGQHGLGMCASGERRNLHLVATIRGVVPAKVGEVAASQGREVGAAPLAGPHLGATFDLVPA